jgi:hypothetical protein
MSPTIEIAYPPALLAVPAGAALTARPPGTAADDPELLMLTPVTLTGDQFQHQLSWLG